MKTRLLHPKRRGEIAELAFAHRAARAGLIVCRPHGDSAPFDSIVLGGRKLSRVQIKSATRLSAGRNAYAIVVQHNRGARRASYTTRDIDFVAAYIEPEDTWYIFPPSVFRNRKTLKVPPSASSAGHWLAPWRERWDLLFDHSPLLPRLEACAAGDFPRWEFLNTQEGTTSVVP